MNLDHTVEAKLNLYAGGLICLPISPHTSYLCRIPLDVQSDEETT
jgi:hypothetical protein